MVEKRPFRQKYTFRDHFTGLFSRGFLRGAHSVGCVECASRKKTREKRVKWSRKRKGTFRLLRRPSAARADGTRRSTVGTLNMGTWAGTGEKPWPRTLVIASDVPSTSPTGLGCPQRKQI